MQFPGLGYAVVIGVLPQTQGNKCGIVSINHAIAIATVCRLIVFRQRQKAISRHAVRRNRLWCEVAKQLFTIVHHAIAVSI